MHNTIVKLLNQYRIFFYKKKNICLFRRLNLKALEWPFKQQFHIIFCRNVLYYFDLEQQQTVVSRMYDMAKQNGFLITSVTESLKCFDTKWKTIAPGIHYKI